VPPRVSVAVPTFNGQQFLVAALSSISAQTAGDIEVIVVDDGSSDGTLEIARGFAGRDARFRVIANDRNLGLVGNWARCIELAQGEWLKFVFQDDLIEPTCIEELLAEGERTGCPFVFCRRRYLFAEGTPEPVRQFYLDHARLTEERFRTRGFVPPRRVAQMILEAPTPESNFIGEPIAVLFKKSVIEKFGSFNPLISVSCDSEFWQRAGVNVGVAHVPKELAGFRVHPGATTSSHLREREFRMNVLDPVVVLHEQAFHPAFEPLRSVAREQGRSLEAMFREKAVWAFNTARHLASPAGGADDTPLRDWRRAAANLPRLAKIEAEAARPQGLAARALAKARRLLSAAAR
jgi:hypothetical protein